MAARRVSKDPAPGTADVSPLVGLVNELERLRADLVAREAELAGVLNELPAATRASARNLVHYVSLRRHDLRELQDRLAELGLSSLGRAEAHVLNNVNTVLALLARSAGLEAPDVPMAPLAAAAGRSLLEARTRALLGPKPAKRSVRIMVTMSSEAASDPALVHDLVAGGMDCMRINCAHDDAEAWAAMIGHLKDARQKTGRACRVLMDIAGPKLRTGAVEPGPGVVKWRPRRDSLGRVTAPARVWLTPEMVREAPPSPADACLPLPGEWLARLEVGAELRLRDAREAKRRLLVVERSGQSLWAESHETAYVATGAELKLKGTGNDATSSTARVGDLAPLEQTLLLRPGDTLWLEREAVPGRPALLDGGGRVLEPARISCTLPEVFADLKPGQPVWFDDSRIGGVVRHATRDRVEIEVRLARAEGEKLGADKGINLPESTLRLGALTAKDEADLEFVARHADLVGFSFVRTADDVRTLQERLAKLGGERLGVVLKIETRHGFDNLPALLLAAMKSPAAGVMIARGDLAVECGTSAWPRYRRRSCGCPRPRTCRSSGRRRCSRA